jgi:hypothetical protein
VVTGCSRPPALKLPAGLGKRGVFVGHLLGCRGVHIAGFGFVSIDQQQILHVITPLIGWIADTQSNGPRQTTSSG